MSVKFYQVGGSVRDELMGVKSKDIDYAVEADSWDAMREAILERGGQIFLETPQYFTIRAMVPGMGACDFVLCRKDGEYKDGRHPETVEVGSILDDLARRDFTMNAIAKGEDGTIIDPHHGVRDITTHYIRCVGKAVDRFNEDGLRMLRAIRFAITKGMILDADIDTCLSSPSFFAANMKGISLERVREELHKCFKHDSYQTLQELSFHYPNIGRYIFYRAPLWLKPTLEVR